MKHVQTIRELLGSKQYLCMGASGESKRNPLIFELWSMCVFITHPHQLQVLCEVSLVRIQALAPSLRALGFMLKPGGASSSRASSHASSVSPSPSPQR